MKTKYKSKLIRVDEKVIPFIGHLEMLEPEELKELEGELVWLETASHERRVKARLEREAKN